MHTNKPRTQMILILVSSGISLGACASQVGDDAEALLDEKDTGSVELALAAAPSGFMLRYTENSLCLDVSGTTQQSYTQLKDCHPSEANQRWSFDGAVLKHLASGLCLDIVGASQGDAVAAQLFACHRGPNQDFRLYPVAESPGSVVDHWYLLAKHSGKCVVGSAGNPPRVVQRSCQNSILSSWYLVS